MNECDADRVLQVRQAVREQAHCELPALMSESPVRAAWQYHIQPLLVSPIPAWLYCIGIMVALRLGRWMGGKSSRKSS